MKTKHQTNSATETRTKEEENLRRMATVVRDSNDAITIQDFEGRITAWNRGAELMYGYSEKEAFQKNINLLTTPDKVAEQKDFIRRQVSGEAITSFETQRVTKDGRVLDVWMTVTKLMDDSGKPVGLASTERDITERKRSEEKYRLLIDNSSNIVYTLNADGVITFSSPSWTALLGHPLTEVAGQPFRSFVHPDDFASLQAFIETKLKTGQSNLGIESRLRHSDGSWRWHICSGNPIRNNSGKVVGFQAVNADITELKQLEKQGRLAREVLEILNHLEGTTDTIRDILKIIRKHTGIEAVGIRLHEGDDYPYYCTDGFPEDFLNAERYLCERDKEGNLMRDSQGNPELDCMCGNVLRGRTDPALPFFTESGSFWSNCTTELLASTTEKDRQSRTRNRCNSEGYESVALIPLRSGKEIIGLLQFNDHRKNQFTQEMIHFLEGLGASIGISLSRQRAEEEIHKSHNIILEIINAIPVRVFWKDKNLVYLGCNMEFARDAGFSDPKDIIGKDDFQMSWRAQAELYHLDDMEVINTGIPKLLVEESQTTPEGKNITLLTSKVLLHNFKDEIIGVIGTYMDITENKRAKDEKLQLEAQLNQSQKLESIGQLAGGIAHDFNNMLAVINGYSEMLLLELDLSDPKYKRMNEIYKAGVRSADLTRQLLAFARKEVIFPKVLNLNDAIKGMLNMLRRLIGENIKLVFDPAVTHLMVKMDPSQVDQILANLLVNANDAIPGNGKVIIETGQEELDEAFCKKHLDFSPGKYVVLSVSDNGCGMDKETLAQIFEPFYTTKGVGEGTGLGLSTLFGIVKQNNGSIDVSSEPGKGTTFRIYLPLDESESDEKDKKDAVPELVTGTETVLLVEDETPILEFARELLGQLGYTVLTAASPLEAIKKAKEYKSDIHIIVTDMIMPEMSGSKLRDKLASFLPDIKCLFISGYTADIISTEGVLDTNIHFLQKPFTAQELSVKLREALK